MSELQDMLSDAIKKALAGEESEDEAAGEAGSEDQADAQAQPTTAADSDQGESAPLDEPVAEEPAPAAAEGEIDADSPLAAALTEALAASDSEPAEPVAAAGAAETGLDALVAETPSEEPSVSQAVATLAPPETTEAEEAEETEEAEEEEEEAEGPPVASPYDLPGAWYVVHSYSGYENKVKANLESRIRSMHMEDSIFDVMIPMEDVVEFKGGRKVTVKKKVFPGYILVRLYLDDDAWFVVRNTPGVTGFVGSGTKPTPLSRREVERILGVTKADEKKKTPRFKPDWEVGETVRVVEGPFADFNGMIEDINIDQSKVRVLVDIFGRETPVELNFDQIQKY